MATFSPFPAPRRSSRLHQRPNSPGRLGSRADQAGGSRLATPSRLLSRNIRSSHPPSPMSMDVDDIASVQTEHNFAIGEAVYANTDEMYVSFYANLPVEVKQVLRNADFYKIAYMGGIDTMTGFAVVASSKTCFVWQHAQAIKGTPTCYIFSCPPDSDYLHPPFHTLVPHGASREPGLILVSQSGLIRFWDSIGIGLAGGDNYIASELGLKGGFVTNLVRVESQTFIASTSNGILYRLALTSTGGKYHLTSRLFSRPPIGRSLSSLLPSFLGSSSSVLADHNTASQYIRSIALGRQSSSGEQEVWALGEERIQRWVMKTEGWEEKTVDQNLSESIRIVLQNSFMPSNSKLDLELLDLAVNEDGTFVLLVSYAGQEETGGLRRLYALAQLELVGNFFTVRQLKNVPYQNTSTPGAPVVPRIQLLFSGSLVSVEFGDTVAFCAQDSDYQDRLQLKSTTDRTLGVGVSSNDTLLILTASTMMQVQLSMDKIRHFSAESGRANLIKSIMMQAILYGPSPENPLHFSFPPDVDEESLMRGAEQLSSAILQSDPEVVGKIHDLTAQLTGRKERLSWLIGFINENSVLAKMSQRSRQRLATDAEMLYVCHHLWLQYNDLLATSPSRSVLSDCVRSYMAEVGESSHEDLMRTFFRFRVSDVGKLITKAIDITNLTSRETGNDLALLLPQANRIIVTVLRSAFDYRAYNLGVYGIQLPMINPWTSRPAIIDAVLSLFDATTKVVEASIAETNTSHPRGKESGSQLAVLAVLLFECINERLGWLSSPVASNEPGVSQDMGELEQRFALLRPEVLETLRRCGYQEAAFSLAEKYRDFASLVALCHRDTVFPPENNPNATRIQSYVDKYKDGFTDELYQWYIQYGELRVMFNQESRQSTYIDRFFDKKPNPGISWLHHIGNERYGIAASDLLEESGRASSLHVKHLMLSIGKLSQLAQLHETNEVVNEEILDAFHDELDFVSVCDALLREFRSALDSVRGRHSLEVQIDVIMKTRAAGLSEKKALAKGFRDLVKHLLQGKALSVEDVVDLLTLKDNADTVTDCSTALHLLVSVQNMPEPRKLSTLRSIWRRIYLHDDWNAIRKTANVSDADINDRLRSTALYATLCSILSRDTQPAEYETTPSLALVIPSPSQITSRWPGISDDQVGAIIKDYNLERDRLGELELEDIYHRVRELALQDAPW